MGRDKLITFLCENRMHRLHAATVAIEKKVTDIFFSSGSGIPSHRLQHVVLPVVTIVRFYF